MTCDAVRERIHEAFDAEPVAELPEEVRGHLAACPSCRELAHDLATLRAALRGLPREPLPPAALEAVWRETSGSPRSAGRPVAPRWRAAAAAVVVTVVGATSVYLVSIPGPVRGPSATELARAEAQAEMVFGYTARALAATKHAATRDVIEHKISPAMRAASSSRL